jgi:quercetin dioxygenase-like cupin family protein
MAAPADVLVGFDSVAWQAASPASRFKAVARGTLRVRLLELSEGFVEPEWCTQGHAGRVLEGSLTLRTPSGAQRLRRDDVFVIEPGEEHAHKAELGPGERALLLLFETVGA